MENFFFFSSFSCCLSEYISTSRYSCLVTSDLQIGMHFFSLSAAGYLGGFFYMCFSLGCLNCKHELQIGLTTAFSKGNDTLHLLQKERIQFSDAKDSHVCIYLGVMLRD